MSDINVTVTNAGSANVSVSNGSTVSATVGNGGAVNVSIGTILPGNATVVSGTLTINSTQTLAAGQQAYVVNNGTAYAASLDIGIPAGPATTVLVGNTTTLESGTASVTGTTSGSNLTLSFAIPRGAAGINGTTPSIAVGQVQTLAAGGSATVTATPSNGGANVVLDFGIPRGADGTGGGSSLTLSDATPANLGTASAGSSTLASRSDHTHNLPVISYANLTGVPSNFPTNTTLISGLSAGYSSINHAHNYVTALNNLTGSLTLAAGSNLTLSVNGSTLTLDATSAGLGANDVIDGGFYVGEQFSGITITGQPQSQSGSATLGSWSGVSAASSTAVAVGFAAYQFNKFYVGGDTGEVVSSSNLSSWSAISGSFSGSSLRGMASNGTRSVIVGSTASGNNAWYSDDGVSWTGLSLGGSNVSLNAITYGNGRFVAAQYGDGSSFNGRPFNIVFYTSSDGANWTARTLPDNFSSCVGLAYGNGVFIAVFEYAFVTGSEYKAYCTSTDGITWTLRTMPYANGHGRPRVAFGNGVFAMVAGFAPAPAGSSTAYTSTDGINWTPQSTPVAYVSRFLSYALGQFFIFTGNSATDVISSKNGVSWSLGDLGRADNWVATTSSQDTVLVLPNGMNSAGRKATVSTVSATFSASATSTSGNAVSYQWQVSLDAGTTWTNVSGATSQTLSLTGLTSADSGKRFRVAVSSTGAATAYSTAATLTVA